MDGHVTVQGGIAGNVTSDNHATLTGKIGTSGGQLRARSYLPAHITGTFDYSELRNKPLIDGHELVGDSSLPQIGVNTATTPEIEAILYLN